MPWRDGYLLQVTGCKTHMHGGIAVYFQVTGCLTQVAERGVVHVRHYL